MSGKHVHMQSSTAETTMGNKRKCVSGVHTASAVSRVSKSSIRSTAQVQDGSRDVGFARRT